MRPMSGEPAPEQTERDYLRRMAYDISVIKLIMMLYLVCSVVALVAVLIIEG